MNNGERTSDHPSGIDMDHPARGPSTNLIDVVTLFTNPLFIDDVAVTSNVWSTRPHLGPVLFAGDTTLQRRPPAAAWAARCVWSIDIVAGILYVHRMSNECCRQLLGWSDGLARPTNKLTVHWSAY